MTRSERKELAFSFFKRGFNNADTARKAGIDKNTATKYRREYEAQLRQETEDNPRLLTDILANTGRQLAELDEIRRAAWDEYARANRTLAVICEECEHVTEIVTASPVIRNQLLNTALKTQESRAKMFGVMGVKAEFFAQVAQVKAVQEKLLEFMTRELCAEDRRKLDEYMGTVEMAELMGGEPIEVQSWEQGEEPESHEELVAS